MASPAPHRRWLKFLPFLKVLPIVERELRMASRGKATYRWRVSLVAVGLGVMALLTWFLTAERSSQTVQGQTMFHTLLVVSALYAFMASVSVTADSVSREKREGTLGLLFLTDLRGRDIIYGKLVANSLNTVYGLLGLLPLLAIPILMGGVSVNDGVIAALGVVNLMFLCLALGIFVSTISWDERRATFAAVILGLVVMIGPFAMGGLWVVLFGRGPVWAVFISAISPLFPLVSLVPNFTGVRAWLPYQDLLPSHLLGWVLLWAAGKLAQRSWQSRSGGSVKRTVDERLFTSTNPVSRRRHRRRMLDAHPLVWLLERHPGKRFYADGLVLAILVIWYWGYRAYGTEMFGGPSWFLVVPLAFLLHIIFASWVVAESSMRLLEDRRSGGLELLLCTSLSDRDLIDGHRLALRRLFFRPVLVLAAAEVFVAFTGFGGSDDRSSTNGMWMMLAMAFAVLLDTHALSWIALRLAISLPTVNRVGAYALAITPFGPMVLTALIAPLLLSFMEPGFNRGFPTVLGTWVTCVILVDLVVAQWWCRRSVLSEFREMAVRTQPKAAVAG
jgi:ABC-type transport system involved in multi-copper enzyme maturation permease subunit